MAGIAALILFPLCLLPSLDFLKYNSIISVVSITYITIVSIYILIKKSVDNELPTDYKLSTNSYTFIYSFPLIM